MDGFRTLGQRAAVEAVRALIQGSSRPHAVLLVGPGGVGKTTLALDLAAALLCTDPEPAARPCRSCRSCRMTEHGNHPDLHRVAPDGAGRQIGIGGPDRPRGVRDLVADLALLPVEGGARVAIIESADRMTEDAQSAFLKTLEEPPTDTTLVLCADEEDRLLPTIHSRCARVRLGPVGPRDIETLLGDLGVADVPTAARLARVAGGRPGVAIAYALAPEAATARSEIARRLLDLCGSGRADRLGTIRELLGRAGDLVRALDSGGARAGTLGAAAGAAGQPATAGTRGKRGAKGRAGGGPDAAAPADGDESEGATGETDRPAVRVPPAERRRAALALVAIWQALVRDLALVERAEPGAVRDPALLDDLDAAVRSGRLPDVASHLRRLGRAGDLLEGNVSPELVLDVLALAWTRQRAA